MTTTDETTTDETTTDETELVAPIVTDKRTEPCWHCPWRISNQGKSHPDGWFTKTNLRRLWVGLRRGEDMSCHPTDPANPVSAKAQAAGYRPAPPNSQVMECIGAHIVRQREFMILQDDHDANLRAYRAARPRGLLREGVVAVVTRAMFGAVPMLGGRPLPRPDLNHVDVGHPDLPWTPRTGETS